MGANDSDCDYDYDYDYDSDYNARPFTIEFQFCYRFLRKYCFIQWTYESTPET